MGGKIGGWEGRREEGKKEGKKPTLRNSLQNIWTILFSNVTVMKELGTVATGQTRVNEDMK